MIDKYYFPDNKDRTFVLYKGWVIESDSETDSTVSTPKPNNSLVSIESISPLSCDEHWKYNLKDCNGELLLQHNVRKITWYEDGYFIIYDDNEEDLTRKSKKSGHAFFSSDEFHCEYRIADRHGKLISRTSFESIRPLPKSTVCIEHGDRYNIMNLSGKFLLCEPVDYIFGYHHGYFYSVKGNILYRTTINGDTKQCKILKELDKTDRYYHCDGSIVGGIEDDDRCVCMLVIKPRNGNNSQVNYLINYQYLLFDNWYDNVMPTDHGIFKVKKGTHKYLIDADETIWIDNAELITSDHNHIISKINGTFQVHDFENTLLYKDYTGCIWVDKHDPTWHINTYNGSYRKHFFRGQTSELLEYAQSILISKEQYLALLEKDSVWYMVDYHGNLHECFRNFKL